MPFPPQHTQTPRPLPGHREDHIQHELLIVALRCFTSYQGLVPCTWHSLAPERGFAGTHMEPSPLPSQAFLASQFLIFFPQDRDLFFRQGPSLSSVYSIPVCCSLGHSQITTAWAVRFPAAAGE